MAAGLSLLCLLLAAGSFLGGLPGPFLLLNLLLEAALRPVTQPMRFLVFASGALAIAGGLGLASLTIGWRRVAGSVLVLEALVLGGPATQIPITDTKQTACLSALTAGAVHLPHIRPEVTLRGQRPLDGHEQHSTAAKRLQLSHGLPGTHQGIGGWTVLPSNSALDDALATFDAVWLGQGLPTAIDPPLKKMREAGITWVITALDDAPTWAGQPEHQSTR